MSSTTCCFAFNYVSSLIEFAKLLLTYGSHYLEEWVTSFVNFIFIFINGSVGSFPCFSPFNMINRSFLHWWKMSSSLLPYWFICFILNVAHDIRIVYLFCLCHFNQSFHSNDYWLKECASIKEKKNNQWTMMIHHPMKEILWSDQPHHYLNRLIQLRIVFERLSIIQRALLQSSVLDLLF